MAPFPVIPDRAALVNIDLQNLFVEGAPEGPTIVQRVNAIAAACRGTGMLVVHTAHVLRADGSNAGVLGELMPEVLTEGLLNEGNRSAALSPDLVVAPEDVVIKKPRFGAFYGTDLETVLRSRGIDTIVISGISTDVCCDTTAREANARDFRVLVVSDATAVNPGGATAEEAAIIQRMTLRLIDGMFGQVVSTQEFLNRLAAAVAK